MPELPGLEGSIDFGGIDKPLPDWRKEMPFVPITDREPDDEELTDEQTATIYRMAGRDPAYPIQERESSV